MSKKILQTLLIIGALFYFAEFILHFFGLPILEHDKIFLPTHDRYIAIFALTYAALLILIATNPFKYRHLWMLAMLGILLSMINANYIAAIGGYGRFFATPNLDTDLRVIGFGAFLWYFVTCVAFVRMEKNLSTH